MTRPIKERDQHCQFYGCTHTHNLQIHAIVHWADGGSTSIENGVCICAYHHALVHKGGYSIQAVAINQTILNEQFSQQQHVSDASMFNFEKELRNAKESFNKVRKLSPTTYRFRVLDSNGCDISAGDHAEKCTSKVPSKLDSEVPSQVPSQVPFKIPFKAPFQVPFKAPSQAANHYGLGSNHSTRVECAEPKLGYYSFRKTRDSYRGMPLPNTWCIASFG